MSERDVLYLEHILEAIAAIERYTTGGRNAFVADKLDDAPDGFGHR